MLKPYINRQTTNSLPMKPNDMTIVYNNQPWMYSLLKDKPSGVYYLEVVCGSTFLYNVYLRLTDEEVATFLPDVAADKEHNMTALAKQVMHYGGHGIAGREYLRPA